MLSRSIDICHIIRLFKIMSCSKPQHIIVKATMSSFNLTESLDRLAEIEARITESGFDITKFFSFEEIYRCTYAGSESTDNQCRLNAIFNSIHRKINTIDSLTTKMKMFDLMRNAFMFPLIKGKFLVCEQCKTLFSHANYFCVECAINCYRASLKTLTQPSHLSNSNKQ